MNCETLTSHPGDVGVLVMLLGWLAVIGWHSLKAIVSKETPP